MHFHRRLFVSISVIVLDVMFLLHSQMSTSYALVVTSPPWENDAHRQQQQPQQAKRASQRLQEYQSRACAMPELELKIRSTVPDDIPIVADILSHALMDEDEQQQVHHAPTNLPSPFNFKRKMELLKIKAGVTSLLHSRMETILVGKKLWRAVSSDAALQGLNDRERLRFLWSDESFRTKLEKASKLSHEPHVWKGYNFACAPQNADRLCHKMFTAENSVTGEIVGFCEVAMLAQPKLQNDCEEECLITEEPLPTIVNLVTANNYRRRGVASSILKSASRYVRHQWESDEIALYVEQKNDGAVRMYERLGFQTSSKARSNQLYMKAALSNAVAQPQQSLAMC